MALQKFFAFLLTHGIIVEYVKGIIFLIFRVNAIAGKTAPKPLLLSCITEMERMMVSPEIGVPAFEKIPETAQPEGIRISPSLCIFPHILHKIGFEGSVPSKTKKGAHEKGPPCYLLLNPRSAKTGAFHEHLCSFCVSIAYCRI